MRRWLWAAMVVSASCMTPVIPFGEGKTAKQAQRDTMADHFTPARLVTETTWKGEVSTAKIRVWADGHFRAQNVRWQQTFDNALELANLVLVPVVGVRLAPEYRVWDRHVPASSLADDLAELMKRDAGDDVLAVVGLTTSLPLVSATFDELGLAAIGGRHLMVRGYADAAERKLAADAFRDLLPEERELALEQRRHHKTAVVLLHEIAHCLGVEHDGEEHMITSSGYSHRAQAFSPAAREVMLRALDTRLGRGGKPATPAADPATPSKPLVLHVTAEGQILRDGVVLDDFALDNALEDTHARYRETEIVIKKARKAPASAVERIVSRANAIGLARVSITLY